MPYIPPEVVEKAREMDLLTYLKNYEPQELVHFGGNTYCTREHDSLKISNGKWCWFSRGIGGYSALDYLIKVKEMPFTQAVETIMGNVAVLPPTYSPAPSKPKEKVLLLPKANRCAAHAVEYLHGRGIDYELIDFCISTGRLYESYPHYNAVFVGQDLDGKPRYANLRGIGTDFIGDANGSDKRYSFGISAEAQSDTLNLFESAVDLLSYGTMQKLDGKDWRRENLLSLAGVYIFIISNERYSEFLSQNGLKNDNSVYASAFYDEIDEDSKSTSFPFLKDGSYHADVRYMSEAASERLSQDINANPNDRFDYENYYDTFFSVNFTVGNYDFPLEFRPNYGGISILIPESRMPEFNAEITSKEIMIQSPNYANIQKNTTDYLTSVGLAEDVSIFSSAESYESQRNFAAMIKLFSTSFLILLTVISCANVFNVITTSLNMRKREFAVLRSVGMTVNKLFAMLCIENLRNGLLAILIGGISSLPLCYLIYKSIVVGAVIDFVFPLGAFVISSLAMFLIMFLTSLYGLWKIKNGDIIADVRNDFV